MPELRSRRESSTLSAEPIPIQGDHLFQVIPTTHSDGPEKVATFRPERAVAFRRNQWPPSRRNRWPLSPGKRNWQSLLQSLTGVDPMRCEVCGQNALHWIGELKPAQSPRAPPQ